MRLSESNMNAKINSEIHASLRRLEDADYVYNQIHSEDMALVIDQSNEADASLQQQINALTKEVYQLHNWVEPHVYLGDLQYFQTLFVGNLQVESGGLIQGNVTFTGGSRPITFEKNVKIDGGLDIIGDEGLFTPKITMGSFDEYNEHTLTIDGTVLDGKVIATQDITFDPAGLVEGNGSGGTLTIRTKKNHTSLLTYTLEPKQSYNSTTHKYQVWCNLLNSTGGTVTSSGSIYTNDQAYKDGQDDASTSYPPNSATFEWFETVDGEPHFRRTGGDFFGRTSRVVYWD